MNDLLILFFSSFFVCVVFLSISEKNELVSQCGCECSESSLCVFVLQRASDTDFLLY